MEGNITHTTITSYGYGTLRLKKGPNLPGPIFPTLHIFVQFFILINYSLQDPIHIYAPDSFIFATHFRDSHLRPTFATPFRDSHSRPTFATHIRDSRFTTPFTTSFSQLTFVTTLATHICDSHSRPHSRLSFVTPDCTPNRDLLFFCRDFCRATPPLTDRLC